MNQFGQQNILSKTKSEYNIVNCLLSLLNLFSEAVPPMLFILLCGNNYTK